MKMFYRSAVLAMALCATTMTFTSCGDDDDNNTTPQESYLDESQFKTSILGSWSYDSGVVTSHPVLTVNGHSTTWTKNTRDIRKMTLTANAGTYYKLYSNDNIYDDGTTKSYPDTVDVEFTYEYVKASEFAMGYDAYLECKVTKSSTSDYNVGDSFEINIQSMTANKATIFTSKEDFVNTVEMKRN